MAEPPDTGSEGNAPTPERAADGPAQPALPAGARCGRHPDVEAHATCKRCGNFMCRMCSREGTSPTCVTCLERGAASFPFTRDGYTLDGLLSYSIDRFKEHWVTLCVATLIFFAITFGAYFVSNVLMVAMTASGEDSFGTMVTVQWTGAIIQMVLQIWIQMGLMAICLDVLEGREVDLTRLFSQADKLLGAILVSLIYNLIGIIFFLPVIGAVFYFIFQLGVTMIMSPSEMLDAIAGLPWLEISAGALLISIPYTYVMVGLTYAVPAMVHKGCGPIDGIREGWRLARDKRMSMLGILSVAIIIGAAGLLACCVGVVVTVPAATVLFMALYLALDNDPRAAR
jgi:hypothetical protein